MSTARTQDDDEFAEPEGPKLNHASTLELEAGVSRWTKIDTLHKKNLLERGNEGICGLCCGCDCGAFCTKNNWSTLLQTLFGPIIIYLFATREIGGNPIWLQIEVPHYTWPSENYPLGNAVFSGFDPDMYPRNEWQDHLSPDHYEFALILQKIGYPIINDSDFKLELDLWFEIAEDTNNVEVGVSGIKSTPDVSKLYWGLNNQEQYDTSFELAMMNSITLNPQLWKDAAFANAESQEFIDFVKYIIPYEISLTPMDEVKYKQWAMGFWVSVVAGTFMGYFILQNMIKTVEFVMNERQNGTKDLMAFLGLDQFQYWMAQLKTHFYINGFSMFFSMFAMWVTFGKLKSLHGIDVGGGAYVYVIILFVMTYLNVALFGFALSSFLLHETYFSAWSLVVGMLCIFIPQIFMTLLENNDNAGERFMLQFIPIFNFFFGLRDSVDGVKADTVIFHFLDTLVWGYLMFYFDNTIPTAKGAQTKEHCYCCKNVTKKVEPDELITMDPDAPQSLEFQEDAFLEISQLTKKFGDFQAVGGVDLKLPKDKIFGLLGFNGAGKSTTINMITGLLKPTSGIVKIAGKDVTKELESLRRIMGVCPQTNIMWEALSVMGHLRLFGRLRGFNDEQIADESDSLLKVLNMAHVKDVAAGKLSGGEKRKLMVMQAFMGDPPFILLDEPTAGVDIDSRDQIQSLIEDRKTGKLIILTTHHMSEADRLSDDIAIMAEGQIEIRGTPTQLKEEYGSGTTFQMKENQDSLKIMERIQSNFDATSDIQESGYLEVLCENKSEVPAILRVMEEHCEAGQIKIDNNSLESVFLNLANARAQKTQRRRSEMDIKAESKMEEILAKEYIRPNWITQFGFMNAKRALLTWKDPSAVCQGMAVVILFAVLCSFFLIVVGVKGSPKTLPTISAVGTPIGRYGIEDLSGLDGTFAGLPETLASISAYKGKTLPIMNSPNDLNGVPENGAYNVKMVNMTVPLSMRASDRHMTSGCGDTSNIADDSETHHVKCCSGWHGITFMNYWVDPATEVELSGHYQCTEQPSCAIESNKKSYQEAVNYCSAQSMRLCYSYEAASKCCSSNDNDCGAGSTFWLADAPEESGMIKKVQVLSTPLAQAYSLPMAAYPILDGNIIMNENNDGTSTTGLNIIEAFTAACFLLIGGGQLMGSLWKYTSNELDSGMYETQVLTGVHGATIWLVNIIWDYALLMIAGLIYISIASSEPTSLPDVMAPWAMSSLGFLCMTYTLGLSTSRSVLNFYLTGIGILCFIALFACLIYDENIFDKLLAITWNPEMYNQKFQKSAIQALRIPFYGLPPLQFYLGYHLELIKTILDGEFIVGETNRATRRYNGISFAFNVIWFGIFLLTNQNWTKDPKPQEVLVDEDSLKEEYEEDKVTSDKCSKVFKDNEGNNIIAVNKVSFTAVPGKCMGVLGKNGAGKSTMMNMLSTKYMPTQGRTSVRGMLTTKYETQIRSFIGICNQKNMYWNEWTAYEHLFFFGGLRGVPYEELDETIKVYAGELKFSEHLNTQMHCLSGGNKRKVALCAAIIGKSDVLYLDEPSAGVDPFARDEMKNTLVQLKDDKTVLFTSHTMEEAEIMCDEIVIMVKGKVVPGGSGGVTDLITKSSKGYFLTIDTSSIGEDVKMDIKKKVQAIFPLSELRPSSKDEFPYLIPFDYKLSDIFEFANKTQADTGCTCITESASLAQLFKNVVHEPSPEEENIGGLKGTKGDVAIEMETTKKEGYDFEGSAD